MSHESDATMPVGKAARKPRRPGRPTHGEDLRDTIVDHAELAFASDGFEGASLRDIAARAGVSLALVRYYFAGKQELYDQLFRTRGQVLARNRVALLTDLLARDPHPAVADIIRAYLRPQWDMKHAGGNAAAFLRLQARVHASPDDYDLKLRREVYDEPVALYVDALHTALPHLPRKVIALRVAFLVGSYMFVLNDLARLEDLAGADSNGANEDAVFEELVRFLATGMAAPANAD